MSGYFVKLDVTLRDGDTLSNLRGAPLSVFIALGLHVGSNGQCFPSIARLCRITGYCRKTVSEAISKLIDLNLIIVHQRRGHGAFANNVYTIQEFIHFGQDPV